MTSRQQRFKEDVRKTNLNGGKMSGHSKGSKRVQRERERGKERGLATVEIDDDAGDDESRLGRQVWNGEELQNSSPKFTGRQAVKSDWVAGYEFYSKVHNPW